MFWDILDDTKKKSEEQKISQILDDRDRFESLERISKEVETIKKELSYDANKKIKDSIQKINMLIDDLYKDYLGKLVEIDIDELIN